MRSFHDEQPDRPETDPRRAAPATGGSWARGLLSGALPVLLFLFLLSADPMCLAAQPVIVVPTPPPPPAAPAGIPAALLPSPTTVTPATVPTVVSTNGSLQVHLGLDGLGGKPQEIDSAIKILLMITLLSLAPSIILLMTCFTRIVIVLSFVRNALSLQGAPANQILIGLSLFLTLFIMTPVWERIDAEALQPYREGQMTGREAFDRASVPIRGFMLRQTRAKDVELFIGLAKLGPTPLEQLPMKVVIPAFIVSELRTAFQMGFLLFVPFILIDLVVATVLMSMGMFMMPPVTISLPLKILLFVLADGWNLVVRSIVLSFAT